MKKLIPVILCCAMLLAACGSSADSTSTAVSSESSSAAESTIGGADGPTAIFVTGDLQSLWGMVVKVFSNVLVIVLNYVFSKLIIFKKK